MEDKVKIGGRRIGRRREKDRRRRRRKREGCIEGILRINLRVRIIDKWAQLRSYICQGTVRKEVDRCVDRWING